MATSDELKRLTARADAASCRRLESALEDAGIPCLVRGQRPLDPFAPWRGGRELELWVPSAQLGRAQEVLLALDAHDLVGSADIPGTVVCGGLHAPRDLIAAGDAFSFADLPEPAASTDVLQTRWRSRELALERCALDGRSRIRMALEKRVNGEVLRTPSVLMRRRERDGVIDVVAQAPLTPVGLQEG